MTQEMQISKISEDFSQSVMSLLLNSQNKPINRSLDNLTSLKGLVELHEVVDLNNLGLDAQLALLEIFPVQLKYLNGSITALNANDQITDLLRRAEDNISITRSLFTNKKTNVLYGSVVTATTWVFVNHYNNLQSVITGLTFLLSQEIFNPAGLQAIFKSFNRPEIYQLISENNFFSFIKSIIYPSPEYRRKEAEFFLKITDKNLMLLADSEPVTSSNFYDWTSNLISNTIDSGSKWVQKLVSDTSERSSGGRLSRVEKEINIKVESVLEIADSAISWLKMALGLLIIIFTLSVLYKGYQTYTIKSRIKDMEKYSHEFQFRARGTRTRYGMDHDKMMKFLYGKPI